MLGPRLLAFTALTLAACSHSPPTAPASSASASAVTTRPQGLVPFDNVGIAATVNDTHQAPLSLAALRVVVKGKGQQQFHFREIELDADGTVLRDGKRMAKLYPDRLEDVDGKLLLRFTNEGRVNDARSSISFDGLDGLKNERGDVLKIGDDGSITASHGGGEQVPVDAQVEGLPVNGKRAALVLLTTTPIGFALFPE